MLDFLTKEMLNIIFVPRGTNIGRISAVINKRKNTNAFLY